MSVDEMNGLLNKMGVQAEVTTTSVPQTMEVPTYTEVVEPEPVTRTDSEGDPVTRYRWKHYTIPGPPETVDGYVQVAQIKSEGNDGVSSTPKLTWTGTSGRSAAGHSPKASTGGGSNKGGGDKSQKEFKPKDRDTSEAKKYHKRYENLTNVLEDMADALERISGISDDAWGAGRVRQLKTYNAQLLAIAKTNSLLIDETKKYYAEDKAALMNSELGALAVFNNSIGEYGGLTNPETLRRYLE